MQPIVMKVALFRGDFDQARSQYGLLWLMEALCRINQSHIRQFRHLKADGKIPDEYPSIYLSGVHYEPEPGTEEWLDIPTVLDVTAGIYPGPWGDCLPLSTLVLRSDYTVAPIGSLVPGDVIMGDGAWTRVLDHAITGKKSILAFELDNGCVFRCSPEHRVFKNDGTEIRAEKIRVGERLLTPRSEFPTSPEPQYDTRLSPEDFAWLLGVFVADGWTDFPRHPSFQISDRDPRKDGLPRAKRDKTGQKLRVKAIADALGLGSRWREKYISVSDKDLTRVFASCGNRAPSKHLPHLHFSKEQVKALLHGLAADAYTASSGTLVYGTTSESLAIQIRILYRMLGQSVHIRRWDKHGGLGSNPIYRINVRRSNEDGGKTNWLKRNSAKVIGIREEEKEMCADITTDTGRFWLPESDLVVHNCEDLACWRVSELRELPYHLVGRDGQGKLVVADPRYADSYRKAAGVVGPWKTRKGGMEAKPFAKWRKRPDGSYAYHALTLLPDGRLEDPSLVLGMGNEPEFNRLRMHERYRDGSVKPPIRYAEKPDVMVVDLEKPSGYGHDTEAAREVTGLVTGRNMHIDPRLVTYPPAAWGYNHRDVSQGDMRRLARHSTDMGFRLGRLGRIGRIGRPDAMWASRFNLITQSIPPFTR
jgi:hypothetical protein